MLNSPINSPWQHIRRRQTASKLNVTSTCFLTCGVQWLATLRLLGPSGLRGRRNRGQAHIHSGLLFFFGGSTYIFHRQDSHESKIQYWLKMSIVRPHCTLSYGFSDCRLDILVFCTMANNAFKFWNQGFFSASGGRLTYSIAKTAMKVRYNIDWMKMSGLTALYYHMDFLFVDHSDYTF